MNSRTTALLFAVAGAGACGAALAQSSAENLSVVFFAGGNADMPGSFRGQTAPLETSDPNGTTTYDDLKFEDAYKNSLLAGAELDYAFSPHLTTFGRFTYSEFNGTTHKIGTFVPGDEQPLEDINANFQDTSTDELDLGARYTFSAGERWRPFVGAALGAAHMSATRAEIGNISGVGTTTVELGRADTVFAQRLETGLQYSPMANFDLRLTAAANHVAAETRSNDPNLALVGLDSVQSEVRGHWDYPVEIGAAWHF